MEWKECKLRDYVKSTFIDNNLINSLIKNSEEKLDVNDLLKMNNSTSSTKFTIVYDSLREVLEALAVKKGFKIYNHECFSAFLNEIFGNKLFAEDFNKFRKIRNAINYCAKKISPEESIIMIKEMIDLRKKLLGELKKI